MSAINAKSKYKNTNRQSDKIESTNKEIDDNNLVGDSSGTCRDGIAIIGMSGFFPASENVQEFLQKIENQESLFSQFPDNHFPVPSVKNRYGAFLNDITSFDSEIFNISPIEAEHLDPRQRLLLMSVWHTLEDACYLPADLADATVDVYIAGEGSPYSSVVAKAEVSPHSSIGVNSWAIPNRISHQFKFKGKSLFIDTACSGSSVALHQAINALRKLETDYAIVGASSLHFGEAASHAYLGQQALGILQDNQSCHPFQNKANGFLPAETAATVMLKRLPDAERDNDNILAVLIGSHVNHVGGYGTLAMPSAESQSEAILKAYQDADIDPSTVTYIEAHGASTIFADAEEIKAFKLAADKLSYKAKNISDIPCKISTLKPNIGHANSASGLVALMRVIHSMNVRKKLGVKDFSECSDEIQLAGSRYYISAETEDWTQIKDDAGDKIPRRAGINNFGAGGVNAHLLIEEYVSSNILEQTDTDVDNVYYLPLSVCNKAQFIPYVGSILAFIQKNKNVSPAQLEYLFWKSRTNLHQRIVFRFNNIENLENKLAKYLDSNGKRGIYFEGGEETSGSVEIFRKYPKASLFLNSLTQDSDKGILFDLWANDIDPPLENVYQDKVFIKRSLPTYPMNMEHVWISESAHINHKKTNKLHPVLHENTSDVFSQSFSSTFSEMDYLLADHLVKDNKMMPGVVYLEVARAAIENAVLKSTGNYKSIIIKNIIWIQPFVVKKGKRKIYVNLSIDELNEDFCISSFEIYSESEKGTAERLIHAQGTIELIIETPHYKVDLEELKSQMNGGVITAEQCYAGFRSLGIYHGEKYQAVKSILLSGNGTEDPLQALGELVLPDSIAKDHEDFVLHPSLMDSSTQVSIGLLMDTCHVEDSDSDQTKLFKPYLPFGLDKIEVIAPCTKKMWAWVKFSNNAIKLGQIQKIDIDLIDEQGNVCVRMTGFSLKMLNNAWTYQENHSSNIEGLADLQEELSAASTKLEQEPGDNESLDNQVKEFLKGIFCSALKIPLSKINENRHFEKYGLDSITIITLTNKLEEVLGTLPKTLLFEYQTIADLAEYFVEHYDQAIKSLTSSDKGPVTSNQLTSSSIKSDGYTQKEKTKVPKKLRFTNSEEAPADLIKTDIAIVGISGCFPQARNVDEFWENLANGHDSITEVPEQRWKWREYFSDDRTEKGRHFSKWGGFIDGVDEFDPLFFNISPREAEILDPQERLFLQHAWMAIEDAGYTLEALQTDKRAEQDHDLSAQIGVYAGVMFSEYQLFGVEKSLRGNPTGFASTIASISNRVSFALNFHGPSMTVDSMCSSSLTAVHLACQDLKMGRTSMALAGGVNVIIHPNKYFMLSGAQFISSAGRCESFGEGGDGYIPGEGVGVLVLKRLKDAKKDCDQIYGVIKGSAINHCGKTNGFTVPNPNAQRTAIERAFRESKVDPRAVSYIEAHGTGTKLGDPIEITGLSKAFCAKHLMTIDADEEDQTRCKIGSVKSNIGHCESAAGVAGIIKILLQMRHKKIAPSLHSHVLNSDIDFEQTPFLVNQSLCDWNRPVLGGKQQPRIAGVSSFGAGGSNAHVVIEECDITSNAERFEQYQQDEQSTEPEMVVLSARNDDRLRDYVEKLLTFVEARTLANCKHSEENEREKQAFNLIDLAYTLQIGREHMEVRIALLCHSMTELAEQLKAFLDGQTQISGLYTSSKSVVSEKADNELVLIEELLSDGKLGEVLNQWVNGARVIWNKLDRKLSPRKISLPTYPFARESYWIEDDGEILRGNALLSTAGLLNKDAGTIDNLHPLLHKNTSDFYQQRYSTVFSGNEIFLMDHQVDGEKMLPGSAYLEMAIQAFVKSMGSESNLLSDKSTLCIRDFIWSNPFVVKDVEQEIHIGLIHDIDNKATNDSVSLNIYCTYSDPKLYANGYINVQQKVPVHLSRVDVNALFTRFQTATEQVRARHRAHECYRVFSSLGVEYGESFQGLKEVYIAQNNSTPYQVLAKINLSQTLVKEMDIYLVHPSILDCAFQATMGIFLGQSTKRLLPYFIEKIEVFAATNEQMWVHINSVQIKDESMIDVCLDLFNEDGLLCVQITGLGFRQYKKSGDVDVNKILMAKPIWNEAKLETSDASFVRSKEVEHYVYGYGLNHKHRSDLESWDGIEFNNLDVEGEEYQNIPIAKRFSEVSSKLFVDVRTLLNKLDKSSTGPKKILLQLVVPESGDNSLFTGLQGLIKTARLENPNFVGQVIALDVESESSLQTKLKTCCQLPKQASIKFSDERLLIQSYHEVERNQVIENTPWKERGTYLITGGAGGLGLIMAEEIARKTNHVNLILVGRSDINLAFDELKKEKFSLLADLGAGVFYKSVDICDSASVNALMCNVKKEYGYLNGIIHSAGITKDNFILKKKKAEFDDVLAPKVMGLANLYSAATQFQLDFFALFSSVSSVAGNLGQADYATANAFMDAFANYNSKQCSFPIVSINWPLWENGGLQVADAVKVSMQETMGVTPLKTEYGIHAFYQALTLANNQLVVLQGDATKIRDKTPIRLTRQEFEVPSSLISASIDKQTLAPVLPPSNIRTNILPDRQVLKDKTISYLRHKFIKIFKLKNQTIQDDDPFEKFGIDSVIMMELIHELEKTFSSLSKTLFFEYRTLNDISDYFVDKHHASLISLLGVRQIQPIKLSTEPVAINKDFSGTKIQIPTIPQLSHNNRFLTNNLNRHSVQQIQQTCGPLDVAIIGLSGKYPGANNLEKYWENLRDGKDCITEVPNSRWDWRDYYSEDRTEVGKHYSKWGGFIDGVDQFDPRFFNLSPKEAAFIDPQERLFLEHAWMALEDSGYTRDSLKTLSSSNNDLPNLGNQVGVYAGVMFGDYQLFGAEESLRGNPVVAGGSYASIANRVSYILDINGPSITLDTMCSSSLSAIHLACQDLKTGRTNLAIAGGVNVTIHPKKYLMLSSAQFISSSGHCESFGEGGDGYVPGEGIGVVLLKRLADAERDGDQIYGVIKGSALNHGGKTSGYSVPNPKAQKMVIEMALKEARVVPAEVSYVEAHGTGTKLGDPIEINALAQAFSSNSQLSDLPVEKHCWVGSAKSNIGHCESAAGIAGVTKVLLQMKHGKIAPSLHSSVLNPNIEFTQTPFTVNQELCDWQRPIVNGKTLPRVAGVSSFGAGGANAHLVIEEYKDKHNLVTASQSIQANNVIVLSARDSGGLKQAVTNLEKFIDKLTAKGEQELSELRDLAYTLQVGREAMKVRMALVASSVGELKQKLQYFLASPEEASSLAEIYHGNTEHNTNTLSVFRADEDLQEAITAWFKKEKYNKILELWVKGLSVDWHLLYDNNNKPRRMSLPTYPFKKERFWIETSNDQGVSNICSGLDEATVLHPLIHRNTSNLKELKFSSTFAETELYLQNRDDKIKEEKQLPVAAYLEMAKEAIQQVSEVIPGCAYMLDSVVWNKNIQQLPALEPNKPKTTDISLVPCDDGKVAYEIYTTYFTDVSESLILNQGYISIVNPEESSRNVALKGITNMLDMTHIQTEYEKLTANTNIIDELYTQDTMPLDGVVYPVNGLAKVSLAELTVKAKEKFSIHPDLLAVISSVVSKLTAEPDNIQIILASLNCFAIIKPCTDNLWLKLQLSRSDELITADVELYTSSGELCGYIEKLTLVSVVSEVKQSVRLGGGVTSTDNVSSNSVDIHKQSFIGRIVEIVCQVTGARPNTVELDSPFEELGFDSVMIVSLNQKLRQFLGELDSTLYFKYNTIRALSDYLFKAFPKKALGILVEDSNSVATKKVGGSRVVPQVGHSSDEIVSLRQSRQISVKSTETTMDIAIVGLAGKYPKADSVEEFWQNLLDGCECIEEIPSERWALEGFYEPDRKRAVEQGLSYSKWGGFISDMKSFDPLFFSISPREAVWMDPHERKFLEAAWECLEDSGYTRDSVINDSQRRIGVFVGATFNNYQLHAADLSRIDRKPMYATNSQVFSIANRVSYFMNFRGPSLTVDTACSSSLQAIHLACESIRKGESRAAIAGGVNLTLHPSKYVTLCQGQFNASDGRCRAFSEGGSGYVPAEGVGAVLMKPLDDAIAERNHIYGVIKGSGASHAGKTNGYTVPSPIAQSQAIENALNQAKINPRTITNIEAHGTGTELGDPIEFQGLVDVFDKYTQDKQFCSISSVKSNIGHPEAAAGIAQLTKVLMQFKHKMLARNVLYGDGLNPNINFEQSPFKVQQQTSQWRQPIINDEKFPRRSGISSFGAGGANVHLIVEEYLPQDTKYIIATEAQAGTSIDTNPVIIPLSARNKDRLKAYAVSQLKFLNVSPTLSLTDVAYTLQVGREAMDERLAFVANSVSEVTEKLQCFVNNSDNKHVLESNGIYAANIKREKGFVTAIATDEDLQDTIQKWIQRNKIINVLELWIRGVQIDWHVFYQTGEPDLAPARISLPTYPFLRTSYWLNDNVSKQSVSQLKDELVVSPDNAILQPVVKTQALEDNLFETLYFEDSLQAIETDFNIEQINENNICINLVCMLSGRSKQEAVLASVGSISPAINVVFVAHEKSSDLNSTVPGSVYLLDDTTESYLTAFNQIASDYGEIDCIAYLWPLEERGYAKQRQPIVSLIKTVAKLESGVKQIQLVAATNDALDLCYIESWLGFERSLALILPTTQLSVVYERLDQQCQQASVVIEEWTKRVLVETLIRKDPLLAGNKGFFNGVMYQNGTRYVCKSKPVDKSVIESALDKSQFSPIKNNGTYLITGGCGGLGFIFAKHLINSGARYLVLTGRTALTKRIRSSLAELEQLGGVVHYLQADVADVEKMRTGIQTLDIKFRAIQGIVHAAGIAGEKALTQTNISSFEAVIEPKIKGTLVLDEILGNEPLDFVCYFSSSSAVLGDAGSCNYSIANRFLMSYGRYREELRQQGRLNGKTLVINWPLWEDGGIGAGDDEQTQFYLKTSGQRLLESYEGVTIFDHILCQDKGQIMVFVGKPDRVNRFMGLIDRQGTSQNVPPCPAEASGNRPELKGLSIEQCVEWDLKDQIHKLIGTPHEVIDNDSALVDFGFDSVSFASFAQNLSQYFSIEITPAQFFVYPTIAKLISYLLEEFNNNICQIYHDALIDVSIDISPIIESESGDETLSTGKLTLPVDSVLPDTVGHGIDTQEPIAIIGMSGRFPDAESIEELWALLSGGKSAVKEVPADRFDWREFFGNPNENTSKTNSKWGGFIPGVEEFDSQFFDIAPFEAKTMDPRQRHLLQESWKALENAGLGKQYIHNSIIGTYVGVEEAGYGWSQEGGSMISNHSGILAARLSYFLGLKGPAMAINTACSSGLVAAHQAILSLRSGECDTAIAAGVNLMLGAESYVAMAQAGMLSPDGVCSVFDSTANGLVPGESIAVVVLKCLSMAERDGDPIHGVIQGSGINYDGKTNGITAPSGSSQAELLQQIYQRNQINPENIEYFVAHGTGTKLGDPVELNAATEAFKKFTDKQGYCAVTSTKSNLGHTFAASGLVSLISMTKAIQHETIPASLNFCNKNEFINWNESPFFVNKNLRPWKQKSDKLRMGAVSAFGMSGTNAHMVIREYRREVNLPTPQINLPFHILMVSAKSETQLMIYLERLVLFLSKGEVAETQLSQLSYTLQEGRYHFKHRCALVVDSVLGAINDLKNELKNISRPNVFRGILGREFKEQKAIRTYIDDLIGQSKKLLTSPAQYYETLCAIAEFHCQGYEINWAALYDSQFPSRIAIPGYPFVKERYPFLATSLFSKSDNQANYASKQNADAEIESTVVNKAEQKQIDGVCDQLIDCLRKELWLEKEEIDKETKFVDLHLNSLTSINIISSINQIFAVNLPGNALQLYRNIDELSNEIKVLIPADIMQITGVEKGIIKEETSEENQKQDCISVLVEENGPSILNQISRDICDTDVFNYLGDIELDDGCGIVAPVIIDKENSYHFDHPYDHIPGSVFIEIINKISSDVMTAMINLDAEKIFHVFSFRVNFLEWADIDGEDPVVVKLNSISCNKDIYQLSGKVLDGEKLCTTFVIKGSQENHNLKNNTNVETKKHKKVLKKLVNKTQVKNVMIGDYQETEGHVEYFSIFPVKSHSLYDASKHFYSCTHITELARQCLTHLANEKVQMKGQKKSILLSVRIELDMPIPKKAELRMSVEKSEITKTDKMFEETGFCKHFVRLDNEENYFGKVAFESMVTDVDGYNEYRTKSEDGNTELQNLCTDKYV